jgi:uncharacterized membrane protein
MATKIKVEHRTIKEEERIKNMEILLFLGVLILMLGILDLAALKWGKSSRKIDPIVDAEISTLLAYKS